MTVRIERDGDEIVWAAPAMTWREGDEWRHDFDAFAGWPELRFDAQHTTWRSRRANHDGGDRRRAPRRATDTRWWPSRTA